MNWIITDIEGTTTSIDFVHKVLFPYAHAQMSQFLEENSGSPEVAGILNKLWTENLGRSLNEKLDLELITAKLQTWIDEDKKHPLLKSLQGKIWKSGYEKGHYRSHIYPDVPPALNRWQEQNISLAVYSSGSVEAQKLLFAHSDFEDLTPFFQRYFDTAIGHKREVESYLKIIELCKTGASCCLFLSDIAEELDAAHAAGMRTYQLLRTGTEPSTRHRGVKSFEEIVATPAFFDA